MNAKGELHKVYFYFDVFIKPSEMQQYLLSGFILKQFEYLFFIYKKAKISR